MPLKVKNMYKMKKSTYLFKKTGILFLMLFTSVIYTYAIKAYPGLVTVTQPDGSKLTIQVKGDEFFKFKTTSDGFLIKQNSHGFYVYANVDAQNKIVGSSQIARNPEQRTSADAMFLKRMPENIVRNAPRNFQRVKSIAATSQPRKVTPYFGIKKSLVILVNFSDRSYVVPSSNASFTNLLNQAGYSANGATGSAKDYFMASTYGKFTPQFDVVGPYTLNKTIADYGANDQDGYDVDPTQMIADACKLANDNGLDYSQYDTDNDGYVDNVFVYYAGYNEAEGADENTIWPHRWVVAPGQTYNGTQASVTFDGKIVYDYACTSELNGTSGSTMCGVGTFCHEFGHVLGLPDYYDTSGTQYNTLNEWSIMDAGAYNNEGRTPPTYSAYDRFYLGYSTPTEVKTPTEVVLYPISQSKITPSNFNNQSILLSSSTSHNLIGDNPNPKEFFVLEYRKKIGWDTYLPQEGLFIWHIDYDATAWNDNSPNNYTGTTQTSTDHMRVYLQPLVGSTTTPGSAFTSGSFTPTLWAGTSINRNVTEITPKEDYMWFKVMDNIATSKINFGVVQSNLVFSATKTGETKIKNLNIKIKDISSDISVTISGTNAGSFTVNTNTITKATASSATGYDLNVLFTPTSTGTHTATLTLSGTELTKVINLSGTGN